MFVPSMRMSRSAHATQVREDEAKAIARKYVDEQLTGYTIEQVTQAPGGCGRCTVRLKGPKGEGKTVHMSPFGRVMHWGATAPVSG